MAKRKAKPLQVKDDKLSKATSPIIYARSVQIGEVQNAIDVLSTTDVSVTGTVDAFGKLETKLLRNDNKVLNYETVTKEINELKASISNLEELKAPIRKLEEFMRDNVEFLVSSIETKGKFNTIENDLSSIQKRLVGLEDYMSKGKDRTIAIWAVVIALISSIASIAMAIWSISSPP